MCLTPEALAMFLNLLSPDIIDVEPNRITVRAEVRDAVWLATGDKWCTDADRTNAAHHLDRAMP
ncbi:hypothetical protein OB2597_06970 [Pseudooceanicola batsensis HTCC2597]|uniref:Uncharacterized protein n=1 Tax=Pseudooceanicola batsensis (strain ATCC BAA-863 / DSM 15984 / KCTC 12145 / HTCC2597) TaxID=252305 RepID=A3TTM9_PSEBH|nr:hypothetical protein [Pseudooceanicola batsensis]EAQ05006.1 hypothetical protein OB2597_06970 [Pseudooceanicola batsensis HTCC2597]